MVLWSVPRSQAELLPLPYALAELISGSKPVYFVLVHKLRPPKVKPRFLQKLKFRGYANARMKRLHRNSFSYRYVSVARKLRDKRLSKRLSHH
jgi:hypothetical protein